MGRRRGTGRHRAPIPFQMWDERPSRDVWKDYVDRNHSLGKGLQKIFLDAIFNVAVLDVGPISHFNAGMTSSDLALLRGLASLYSACSYFEIGSRRCESLGNMAKVARECYSLSRPLGELRKKGLRNRYMYAIGSYTRAMQNVFLLSGDSNTFNFDTLNKKFDIIFINSGHEYDRVLNDTRKAFEYLVHDQSVVVWHEYSYFPEQVRFEVLAGILDGSDPAIREQLFFVAQTKCAIFLRESLLQKIPPK